MCFQPSQRCALYCCPQDAASLPDQPAIEMIPDALAAAAKAHGAPGGVVVMVVQPGERNAYDQQVGPHTLMQPALCCWAEDNA